MLLADGLSRTTTREGKLAPPRACADVRAEPGHVRSRCSEGARGSGAVGIFACFSSKPGGAFGDGRDLAQKQECPRPRAEGIRVMGAPHLVLGRPAALITSLRVGRARNPA